MFNEKTGKFEYTPDQIKGVMWFLDQAVDEVRENEDGRWSNEQMRALVEFFTVKAGVMCRIAA
jgi:hypothetical protein